MKAYALMTVQSISLIWIGHFVAINWLIGIGVFLLLFTFLITFTNAVTLKA